MINWIEKPAAHTIYAEVCGLYLYVAEHEDGFEWGIDCNGGRVWSDSGVPSQEEAITRLLHRLATWGVGLQEAALPSGVKVTKAVFACKECGKDVPVKEVTCGECIAKQDQEAV